jgi:hypothetical protein
MLEEGEGDSNNNIANTSSNSTTSTTSTTTNGGDKLRAATGIRPSLHPTTINAIADALKARAKKEDSMAFRVSDTVQPIDVAVTAGKIASTAISKRQELSKEDDMVLTKPEEHTIAGRILGVVMRLDELEQRLHRRVSSVSWIADYGEWQSFGVLEEEQETAVVDQRIREDPLFCMNRAECLLGLFLHEVEIPQLQQKNETVPDGSKIDFLDADRMEVLIETRTTS